MMTKGFKSGCRAACMILMLSLAFFASASPASAAETGQPKKPASFTLPSATGNTDIPLVPIPEPSAASLMLLSLGGVGLAFIMRKQA